MPKKRLKKYLPVILLLAAAFGLTAIVIAITILRTPIQDDWGGVRAIESFTRRVELVETPTASLFAEQDWLSTPTVPTSSPTFP